MATSEVLDTVSSPPGTRRPVKFVASDQDGLPVKRRQVQQACEPCRKKKKRCSHGGFSDSAGAASQEIPQTPGPRQARQGQTPLGPRAPGSLETLPRTYEPSSAEAVASQLVELSTSRFVGDLAPESVFIQAANRGLKRPSLAVHRNQSEVGTWMRDPPQTSEEQCADNTEATRPRSAHRSARSLTPSREAHSLLTLGGRLRRPDEHPAGYDHYPVCPPASDYQHLYQIYFERIHPILPCLNEADTLVIRDPRSSSIRHKVFRQAICLAAGLDPSARGYLRLKDGGPLLSPQDFHHRLAKAIFASLDANMLADRVDHIRVLLLMFLFHQPRNTCDRDMSPLIFSQAVHYTHTLGIHLRGFGKGSGTADGEDLFCLLWALDRINAAFHGRPCLFHERDIDRDLDACIMKQPPVFRLFLRVAKVLEQVITLYRPRSERAGPVDLPVFESMILDAGAEKMPSFLLSTVEVFYHAVSVLSCRRPPTSELSNVAASSTAHLPHPSINARRSLSADRTIDSAMSALSPNPSSDCICILPFVPYGVALALSVMYLKMRYSKIPMYRSRAKVRFQEIVGLLQKLGEVYTCARFNAELGISVLTEMDKTAKGLANFNNVASSSSATVRPAATTPRQTVPERETRPREADGSQQSENNPWGRLYRGEETTDSPRSGISAPAEPNMQAPAKAPFADPATSGQLPQAEAANYESLPPCTWTDISDVDIFLHFDPDFNLNAVDAALEANLDMGYPQPWSLQWPEET